MRVLKTAARAIAVLVVLVGAAVLTLTEGPAEDRRGGVILWTDHEPYAGMDADVSGIVAYDPASGCFRLDGGFERHPLAFPADTWLISSDPIELLVPGAGVVHVGDEVRGGGGYIDPRAEWTVPASCLGASGDIAVLQRIER